MLQAKETASTEQMDEELADILTAISVIAKRLAKKLRMKEEDHGNNEGTERDS